VYGSVTRAASRRGGRGPMLMESQELARERPGRSARPPRTWLALRRCPSPQARSPRTARSRLDAASGHTACRPPAEVLIVEDLQLRGVNAGTIPSATHRNSTALRTAGQSRIAPGAPRLVGLWSRRPRVRVPSLTPDLPANREVLGSRCSGAGSYTGPFRR
jgi:hypothetical protein